MRFREEKYLMFFGADPKTFEMAKRMRRDMTLAEIILWKKLKDRKLFADKFRRQHPVGFYIADFYCHKYKLIIEVDGRIHEEQEIRERDLNREAELKRLGLRIIRFTNDQIISDINYVISQIKAELHPR
jgi:very-short-patch-repair endonuclease